MENKYYVYEYWRLDNNTCFYVGKGTKSRYISMKNRNRNFLNIVNKIDCCVTIIKTDLTEAEALELECKVIDRYVFEEGYGISCKGHKKIPNEPYLVNQTWGGDGISGHKHSMETIEKIRLKRKEQVFTQEDYLKLSNSLKGRKFTDEWSKKKSDAQRGHKNHMFGKTGEKHHWYGKKHTQETKNILSEQKKGAKNVNSKKVMCINTNLIFDCTKQAGEFYNVDPSSIAKNCRGEYKSAGKHPQTGEKLLWRYIK